LGVRPKRESSTRHAERSTTRTWIRMDGDPHRKATGFSVGQLPESSAKGTLTKRHKDTGNVWGSNRKATGFSVGREPESTDYATLKRVCAEGDKQHKSCSPDIHRSIRRFYTECAGRARLVVTRGNGEDGAESDLHRSQLFTKDRSTHHTNS